MRLLGRRTDQGFGFKFMIVTDNTRYYLKHRDELPRTIYIYNTYFDRVESRERRRMRARKLKELDAKRQPYLDAGYTVAELDVFKNCPWVVPYMEAAGMYKDEYGYLLPPASKLKEIFGAKDE